MKKENEFDLINELDEMTEEEVKSERKENNLVVSSVNELSNITNSKTNVFTTIDDNKKIFNLENTCDFKINDCKGQLLRVSDVLIKVIEKPMKEPVIDEETGEVIKDKEYKKICILIDDTGKSYVTASKMFTNQMIRYITLFGFDEIKSKGLEIKIIEKEVKNSSNKALGFELV